VKVFGFFKDKPFTLVGTKTYASSTNAVSVHLGSENNKSESVTNLSYPVCYSPVKEIKTTTNYDNETNKLTYFKATSNADSVTRTNDTTTSLKITIPLLISNNNYLFYQSERVKTARYNENTQIQETAISQLGGVANTTALNVNVSSISDYLDSFDAPGITLKNNSLFLVTPNAVSTAYSKALWGNKTTKAYATKPNIYRNKTPQNELADVPVWAIAFNKDKNTIEVKDDIIVKKVYPLLSDAVVTAASYCP
jgi:hypothetical protein